MASWTAECDSATLARVFLERAAAPNPRDRRRTPTQNATLPARRASSLPPTAVVGADDPRNRPGAVEKSQYVSGEWARSIAAASHRAWTNAAKVIASIATQHPDARYVEGWATKGGVNDPLWHAWVDVPLGRAGAAWMRIDPTPMWRHLMEHNDYGPVVEVRASEMLPFVAPLLQPRGRSLCPLPLAPLAPHRSASLPHPKPAGSLADTFGAAAEARSSAVRDELHSRQSALTSMIHTDGTSELDRLAAMRVLPNDR